MADDWTLVILIPPGYGLPQVDVYHSVYPTLEHCKATALEMLGRTSAPPKIECRLNCVKSSAGGYDCARGETISPT